MATKCSFMIFPAVATGIHIDINPITGTWYICIRHDAFSFQVILLRVQEKLEKLILKSLVSSEVSSIDY